MAHALSICKAEPQPKNKWSKLCNVALAMVPQCWAALPYPECSVLYFGRWWVSQSSMWIKDLTFFPTFTCWWWLAPLAVGLALSPHWALHHIAHVAGEAHHIIQVKAVAYGASIDGAAWVPAADGWRTKWFFLNRKAHQGILAKSEISVAPPTNVVLTKTNLGVWPQHGWTHMESEHFIIPFFYLQNNFALCI